MNCLRNLSISFVSRSVSGRPNSASGSRPIRGSQKAAEWRPRRSRKCRRNSSKLTDEVNSNAEELLDGEFVLNEFIDRFGPRLAHLNGVIQVLAQLSSAPNPTNSG